MNIHSSKNMKLPCANLTKFMAELGLTLGSLGLQWPYFNMAGVELKETRQHLFLNQYLLMNKTTHIFKLHRTLHKWSVIVCPEEHLPKWLGWEWWHGKKCPWLIHFIQFKPWLIICVNTSQPTGWLASLVQGKKFTTIFIGSNKWKTAILFFACWTLCSSS